MALRVFPALLYGQGHAYANPWTGSGTEESIGEDQPRRSGEFHRTWFKPNNATLIVVGATTMAEIRPKLERALRGLEARATCPSKNIGTVAQQPRSTVYLLDRPERDSVADSGRQRGAAEGQSRRARDRDHERWCSAARFTRGST